MATDPALCAWFLFHSGLKTSRAKLLLSRWQQAGATLADALRKLPEGASDLELTPEEAQKLHPPAQRPPTEAICWDDPLYPAGLRDLPLKKRPALLFTAGKRELLRYPRIYLPPDVPTPEARTLLQEAIEILLGEAILPATFVGSETAELLWEVMGTTEGAALLWTYHSLERLELPPKAQKWHERQRLLLITPLPPGAGSNPAWKQMLHAVAQADAGGSITTEAVAAQPSSVVRPTLLLGEAPPADLPSYVTVSDEPLEILFWLPHEPPAPTAALVAETPPEYTRTPEETLQLLESGGHVPEVLRARLQKHS